MRRIRLVIADRRPIVLQGFAPLFAAESDFEVVASCNNGSDCLDAVRRLAPDVALVEDGFSDVTASEMLAAVNTENLPTRLVFYTASVARGDVAAAIAAGACAGIPMREEPEVLMQSLRLVAPIADRAADRKASHHTFHDGSLGKFGDNGPTALTDLERKIMRLVASGLSNKEIARELKVAIGTINARIDHLSTQLETKNRRELATFALSRLYGGAAALAALIWAALDDVQPASAGAVDHPHADPVTVKAADGTGAVVTIKITPQKATAASRKPAKAAGEASRVETSGADSPMRARLTESRADIAAGTATSPTPTPLRVGLSSFGTFALMAVGVSIYEILSSPAQAFTFPDSDFFVSNAANAASEFAALNKAGGFDSSLNGFDKLAWFNPELHSESFVFKGAAGDMVGKGDEPQITDEAASRDSGGDSGNAHVGAGAVDPRIDHDGFEHAGGTDALGSAEHGTSQATDPDKSNDEQSQRDLHVSEEGAAKGKPHAEDGSQKHESNDGQLHHDADASKDVHAAGKKHVGDDAPAGHDNSDKSQTHSHKAHSSDSGKLHAGPNGNADVNSKATDESGSTQAAAAPGDSFHFKNAKAEATHSDHLEDHDKPHTDENGPHNGGHHGPALIQHADLIAPAYAEQSTVDHARGFEHHPMHDLLV